MMTVTHLRRRPGESPAATPAPRRARTAPAAAQPTPDIRMWRLANRGKAVLGSAGGAETLEVYNGQGTLIFQYDTGTGTSRVFAGETGNLDVVNPRGDIRFVAGGAISLCGAAGVRLSASEEATTPGPDAPAHGPTAHLAVEPDHIELRSPRVSVTADQGLIRMLHGAVIGDTLTATYRRGALAVKRLEVTCERLLTRAGSLFQQVEDAVHVVAGRMSTRVKGTCLLRADRAAMKADGEFRIDGDQINLG